MKMNMYTIFDAAANVYMRPFFFQADGQAQRAFQDLSNDDNHEVGKHPEDYTLFRVGSFDDNEGKVTSQSPFKIINGAEAVGAHRNLEVVSDA